MADYRASAPAPKTPPRPAAHDGAKEVDMLPKDIDPTLRTGEPMLESLDDGFSPPAREPQPAQPEAEADAAVPAEPALGTKSPF